MSQPDFNTFADLARAIKKDNVKAICHWDKESVTVTTPRGRVLYSMPEDDFIIEALEFIGVKAELV